MIYRRNERVDKVNDDRTLLVKRKMCLRHTVPFVKTLQLWRVMRQHLASNGHRQREEHKHEERGCKAYPCRLLWRRVAITDGFIHCTPLTSSLGRSFTPSPSPILPGNPYWQLPTHDPLPPFAHNRYPSIAASLPPPYQLGDVIEMVPTERGEASLCDTPRTWRMVVLLVQRGWGNGSTKREHRQWRRPRGCIEFKNSLIDKGRSVPAILYTDVRIEGEK